MPTVTGKTFASFYRNLLSIGQTANTGVTSALKPVEDGRGAKTAIGISDDVLVVQPQNDDTDAALGVRNVAGQNVLAVDTVNSKILGGSSLTAMNTQYAYFGCNSGDPVTAAMVADTHYAIPFTIAGFGGTTADFAMGTATSLTISINSMLYLHTYWFVPDNITIDAVHWLHAADTATGEDTAAHLMAYTVDTGNGSTSGDLSSGTVVADGATITNAGYEQIYYQAMTVQSADVDAGKVIVFTFASDTVNSDYSINATVKYHIR